MKKLTSMQQLAEQLREMKISYCEVNTLLEIIETKYSHINNEEIMSAYERGTEDKNLELGVDQDHSTDPFDYFSNTYGGIFVFDLHYIYKDTVRIPIMVTLTKRELELVIRDKTIFSSWLIEQLDKNRWKTKGIRTVITHLITNGNSFNAPKWFTSGNSIDLKGIKV